MSDTYDALIRHCRESRARGGGPFIDRVVCADGFSMSVQASSVHYCTPRADTDFANYTHWEVGYPSERVESLMSYVDGDGSYHETVYGYVPTQVILDVIAAHGGIRPTRQDGEAGT